MTSGGPFQPILVCDQEGHVRTCPRYIQHLRSEYKHQHEAPLLRCFQYKHCHGYLLIETNSVLLAKIRDSECIKSPGVVCEPTTTVCTQLQADPEKGQSRWLNSADQHQHTSDDSDTPNGQSLIWWSAPILHLQSPLRSNIDQKQFHFPFLQ